MPMMLLLFYPLDDPPIKVSLDLEVRSEAFSSLVKDCLKGNIAPRNDPPGSFDFVFRYIDANFEGAGTISTMTDPPPPRTTS